MFKTPATITQREFRAQGADHDIFVVTW